MRFIELIVLRILFLLVISCNSRRSSRSTPSLRQKCHLQDLTLEKPYPVTLNLEDPCDWQKGWRWIVSKPHFFIDLLMLLLGWWLSLVLLLTISLQGLPKGLWFGCLSKSEDGTSLFESPSMAHVKRSIAGCEILDARPPWNWFQDTYGQL